MLLILWIMCTLLVYICFVSLKYREPMAARLVCKQWVTGHLGITLQEQPTVGYQVMFTVCLGNIFECLLSSKSFSLNCSYCYLQIFTLLLNRRFSSYILQNTLHNTVNMLPQWPNNTPPNSFIIVQTVAVILTKHLSLLAIYFLKRRNPIYRLPTLIFDYILRGSRTNGFIYILSTPI